MTCSTAIYNKVLEEVLPEVPGAAPVHVTQVIKRVVSEFLRRSLVWQETIRPKVRKSGMISLASPRGEVVWALAIMYKGRAISPGSAHTVGATYEALTPTDFIIHGVDKFETGDVEVVCALHQNESGEVPDFIYTNYLEAIRVGVTGYLFGEPFKPYMTSDHSATNLALYRKYTTEAKDEAIRSFTRSEVPWSYPRNFT